MHTYLALIVYLIITLIIFICLCRIHYNVWSALILALIFGDIILNILSPPSSVSLSENNSSTVAIYTLIQVATPIAILFYAFSKAIYDREHPVKLV